MTTPTELRDRASKLELKAQLVQDEANEDESRELGADGARLLTEQEAGRVNKMLDEADGLRAEAEAIEAREQTAARISYSRRRQADPQNDGPDPRPTPQSQSVGQVRERAEDDPSRGFTSPREFITEVMRAGATGQVSDRLRPCMAAGSDEHHTQADPYGGFLVPETFSPNLIAPSTEDASSILTRVFRIPMASPSVSLPALDAFDQSTGSVSGGVVVTRHTETAEEQLTRAKGSQVRLTASTLMAASAATEELISDSAISFAAFIAQVFTREIDNTHLREFIEGSGVSEPTGVLNAQSLVTVPKESGQAADTIVYENVTNMISRQTGLSNAIWMANFDTIPQLAALSQVVGTGGSPIFVQDATGTFPGFLFGRPLILTKYAKTLGDKGDIMLIDWSQYLYGIRQTQQTASSVHVRWLHNEQVFRLTIRDAGVPGWKDALTPPNSTKKLSPFVTLAARA